MPGRSANQVEPLPTNSASSTEAASARQGRMRSDGASAEARRTRGRAPTAASMRRARSGGGARAAAAPDQRAAAPRCARARRPAPDRRQAAARSPAHGRGRARRRHRRERAGSDRPGVIAAVTSRLGSLRSKAGDQPLARAREPRHHGADRDLGHLGDLAIVEALHVAQHQRLAERHRQLRDRGLQPRRVGLGDQRRLRRLGSRSAIAVPRLACGARPLRGRRPSTSAAERFLPSQV